MAKKHESVAINKYIEDTGNNVKQCGLFVSIDFPYLASSPDGLLSQDDVKQCGLFVSIDFPYLASSPDGLLSQDDVKQCGVFVSIDFPYLASSPDGLLSQDDIIEVKCPYVSRDKPINENTVPFLKCNTKEQYYLEPTHNYYYQIQGQLLCTGQKECTLIVCHADHLKVNDIKYVTVPRNDDFIACMVNGLNEFFNEYFKPELLSKLFYKPYYT
jgi:hypothetical protein